MHDVDVSYGACSDVGLVRDLNEDSMFARSPVFAVADGMGGHAAGEVASALAVDEIGALAEISDPQQADVSRAVASANQSILDREAVAAETVGMGTTLSGLCLGTLNGSPHWFVFNVGDSRVYHYTDGTLRQVTTDHSEVAELIASGRITEDEAKVHPLRHVVTRSLGSEPAPNPDIWVQPVTPGERFLICSDGLSLEVSDDEIGALLARYPVPQEAAEGLVGAARAAGGRDNISVVVVDVPDAPSDVDESTAPRPGLGEDR